MTTTKTYLQPLNTKDGNVSDPSNYAIRQDTEAQLVTKSGIREDGFPRRAAKRKHSRYQIGKQ